MHAGIYDVYEQQKLEAENKTMKEKKTKLTFTLPKEEAEAMRKTLEKSDSFTEVVELVTAGPYHGSNPNSTPDSNPHPTYPNLGSCARYCCLHHATSPLLHNRWQQYGLT